MKLTGIDYRAFYKRACADLEFHDAQGCGLDEERLKTALLTATETTEHPYAVHAFNVATEWFRSPRSLHERLGLFFDIMRMFEGAEHG